MTIEALLPLLDKYVEWYQSVGEPFINHVDASTQELAARYLANAVANTWTDIKAALEKGIKK